MRNISACELPIEIKWSKIETISDYNNLSEVVVPKQHSKEELENTVDQ